LFSKTETDEEIHAGSDEVREMMGKTRKLAARIKKSGKR